MKRFLTLALLLVSLSLYSIHSGHYFIFSFLTLWAVSEFLWAKRKSTLILKTIAKSKKLILSAEKSPFPSIERYLDEWNSLSISALEEELSNLKNRNDLTRESRKELEHLCDLVDLKKLLTLSQSNLRRKIRQLFTLNPTASIFVGVEFIEKLGLDDVTEAAMMTAHLYQKVGHIAENPTSYYRFFAQNLLSESFHKSYPEILLSRSLEALTDQLQLNGGVSFLILNLVKREELGAARLLGQRMLRGEWDTDEDLRSTLYWYAELLWFSREMNIPFKDYETCLRYLYHICFTAPERAHFLEIDSQYFSQFDTVNELAREAFLFRETLVQRFLQLWETGEGIFDKEFIEILEVMTQLKSKIYEDRCTWEKTWVREQESFSKDYLYVVEGNLYYANKDYQNAKTYYEKALRVNPQLRSGLLNSVFAYAASKEKELHGWMVDRIINNTEIFPSNLYVAGNSYLLLGDDKKADEFYETLSAVPGWELKTEIYRSTFCFENGLFEKALLFARLAAEKSPEDSNTLYHLSLCYNAVGEKERALEVVKKLKGMPHWLDFYRFTLERDAGFYTEAVETLLTMPPQYFDDPVELEEALSFARNQNDLRLLRHLKNRS